MYCRQRQLSITVFIAEEICSWLSPWLAEKMEMLCLWKGDSQEHISSAMNTIISERVNSRSRSLYARPSVCLSSVMLVRPTQAVEICANISTAFGTLAIR